MYGLCPFLQERPSCFYIYDSSYSVTYSLCVAILAHFPPQKIEEQRITIEDLEALKELEENHIQVERELRDEI